MDVCETLAQIWTGEGGGLASARRRRISFQIPITLVLDPVQDFGRSWGWREGEGWAFCAVDVCSAHYGGLSAVEISNRLVLHFGVQHIHQRVNRIIMTACDDNVNQKQYSSNCVLFVWFVGLLQDFEQEQYFFAYTWHFLASQAATSAVRLLRTYVVIM